MNHRNDDTELVLQVLAGREEAFNRFFESYYPRLFRFALRRLQGDRAAAEDAAQATVLRAIDSLAGWRGEASLLTWLFTLCRRELALLRRGSQIESHLARIEDAGEIRAGLESLADEASREPELAAGRIELHEAVQLALDYLPDDYAAALEAKYLRDESVQQIAAGLGRSVKATESLLTRARDLFREVLLQLHGADAAGNLTE